MGQNLSRYLLKVILFVFAYIQIWRIIFDDVPYFNVKVKIEIAD